MFFNNTTCRVISFTNSTHILYCIGIYLPIAANFLKYQQRVQKTILHNANFTIRTTIINVIREFLTRHTPNIHLYFVPTLQGVPSLALGANLTQAFSVFWQYRAHASSKTNYQLTIYINNNSYLPSYLVHNTVSSCTICL